MEYSELRKWLKNLSRTIVLALGVIISFTFYYSLPIINGFFAVFCGTIVVVIVPSLLHNRVMNPSTNTRICNTALFFLGIIVAIIVPIFLIYKQITTPDYLKG